MRHTSISSEDAQIEYGKLTIQFSICCEVAGASVSVAPYALPTSSVPHGPDKSEAHFDPEEGFAHLLADRKCRSGVCMQKTLINAGYRTGPTSPPDTTRYRLVPKVTPEGRLRPAPHVDFCSVLDCLPSPHIHAEQSPSGTERFNSWGGSLSSKKRLGTVCFAYE